MIKSVKARTGKSIILSTGTKLSVWPATSEDNETAWCARLEDLAGEVMEFGVSHEAFQGFVGLVSQIYAEEAGIYVKE